MLDLRNKSIQVARSPPSRFFIFSVYHSCRAVQICDRKSVRVMSETEYWNATKRLLYIHCPLFKLKEYRPTTANKRYSSNRFVFIGLPSANKIVAYERNCRTAVKFFKFKDKPQAFEIVDIEGVANMVVGFETGILHCRPLGPTRYQASFSSDRDSGGEVDDTVDPLFVETFNERNKTEFQNHRTWPYQFPESEETMEFDLNCNSENPTLPEEKTEVYINDLAHLGNGKVVNCFNNGTIAFWDLKHRKKLLKLKYVHRDFTYKLRVIQERLVSCSHDQQAVVTDMVKMKPIVSLPHPESVWCANPLNPNIVSSVGLFNKVYIWDVRGRRLAQTSELDEEESSFITALNENQLVLGDGHILKRCDLRTMQSVEISNVNMLGSAESILVRPKEDSVSGQCSDDLKNESAIVCGRGSDLNIYHSVRSLQHVQPTRVLEVNSPYESEHMFQYDVAIPNPNDQQIEEEEQLGEEEGEEMGLLEGQIGLQVQEQGDLSAGSSSEHSLDDSEAGGEISEEQSMQIEQGALSEQSFQSNEDHSDEFYDIVNSDSSLSKIKSSKNQELHGGNSPISGEANNLDNLPQSNFPLENKSQSFVFEEEEGYYSFEDEKEP